MAQPTFHTIGIYMQLYLPLVTSHPIALYPPMYPSPPVVPTPANVLEVCKAVGANAIPTVPTFVEVSIEISVHHPNCSSQVSFAGLGSVRGYHQVSRFVYEAYCAQVHDVLRPKLMGVSSAGARRRPAV